MKKCGICLSIVALAFPLAVQAESGVSQELQTALDDFFAPTYYMPVEISGTQNNWQVKLPEVKLFTLDDAEASIPAHFMSMTAGAGFKNQPSYKLSTDSQNRLQSIIYKTFFVDGVTAETYKEEMDFAPSLQSSFVHKINARNIIFNETDDTTGLKTEVGRIGAVSLNMNKAVANNQFMYDIVWKANNLSYKTPFFSIVVDSAYNALKTIYADNGHLDYNSLNENIADVLTSDSQGAFKNIALDVMGSATHFDVSTFNKIRRDENTGTFKLSGNSVISNISVPADTKFAVRGAKLKYQLLDVKIQDLLRAQELQKEMIESEMNNLDKPNSGSENEQKKLATEAELEAIVKDTTLSHEERMQKMKEIQNKLIEAQFGEDDDYTRMTAEQQKLMEKFATIVEDITNSAQVKLQFDIDLDNAGVNLLLAAKKSGKFVIGNGKMIATNLDTFMPDYAAMCEAEKKQDYSSFPESCLKAGFSSAIRQYVDLNKRTKNAQGQTIDEILLRITTDGIYVNNDKIGDAIEFDFNDMVKNMLNSKMGPMSAATGKDTIDIDEDLDL